MNIFSERILVSVLLLGIPLACTKMQDDQNRFIAGKTTQPYSIPGTDFVPKDEIPVWQNTVSMDDVRAVAERCFPAKSDNPEIKYDIIPYIGNHSDTLLYIINYNGNGWKIYSSDKRTPAVLAEGEKGCFSIEDGNPAVEVWLGRIAEDIARVKLSADSELAFSELDIALNRAFWNGKQPTFKESRYIVDPSGHWEETIYATTEIVDTVGHLVAKWDQLNPYNACCPLLVSDPANRAAAGCVAVAGAQMLHYLHGKIGLPTTMYSQGICIGEVGNYTQSFSNPTSNTWSQMSSSYHFPSSDLIPEAIMIGYVGMSVNMHYWDWDPAFGYFSWALPGNLKTNVFEPAGISCFRESYNEDAIRTSLLAQMPVVVSGSNLLIPVDGRIHCFVIDGYKRIRTKYTHWHHFVYDDPPSGPIPLPPDDYTTYTYSNPVLSEILINWGWWSQWVYPYVNEAWFSLTGGWTVTNNGVIYDYNHHLNMTHGFAISE